MSLKIVHISLTPLAGSPIRICQALNLLPDVKARNIQLQDEGYHQLSFPVDLIWERDKEECIELINNADILHLHNYVGLETKDFAPIDFRKLWDRGVPMVRHFHSNPELIANYLHIDVGMLDECPIPKFVCSQYQERFFAAALPMPNVVIDFNKPVIKKGAIRIGYAPSNFRSSYARRWDTKGYHETVKLLKKVINNSKKIGLDIELDIMEKVPFLECQERKKNCDIFIDDVVTGTFHLSSLEAMASGCVALSYLDQRCLLSINKGFVGNEFPVINTRLEEMVEMILHLVSNKVLLNKLRLHSYQWMVDCWSAEKNAEIYKLNYLNIIDNPKRGYSARFFSDDIERWKAIDYNDIIWESRKKYWPQPIPNFIVKSKSILKNILCR